MNVENVIQDDWASEPSVMHACLHIWQALSCKSHKLDHYTFSELARLSESSDEPLVSRALLYLANPKLKVLKTCLMYEFDGGIFELPENEVAHYASGEVVIHPEFGEPIPESDILLCFTPGPQLQSEGDA